MRELRRRPIIVAMGDDVDLDESGAAPGAPNEPGSDVPADDPRGAPPPPPVAAGPRRRLRRRTDDRVVAGVASGLAEYFDASPLAVRTLFGFAALVVAFDAFGEDGLSGIGGVVSGLCTTAVLAYIVLWVAVPRDDADVTRAGRLAGRFPRVAAALGILAVLAGAAVLGAQLGLWDDGLVFPLLLIVGGVLLYRRDAAKSADDPWRTTDPASVASRSPEPTPPASAYAITPAAGGPTSGTPTMPLPVVSSPQPPRPPRERSPLGWLGLGIALLVVGATAILQNLGAIDIPIVRYPAMFLLILGATLLAGTFVGRARWLVLPALLVVPIVLAASLIRVPLEGGIGDTQAYPQSSSAVQGSYRRVIGGIFLDLSALKLTDAQPVVSASTGIGEITIVVPFDAHVIATGRTGVGMITVGNVQTQREADTFLHTTWEPRVGDGPTITLDLETGIGDIHVIRNAPRPRDLREMKATR
jgi:phage shock protein PspC (stress-responsive transcriptional regulator)